MVTNNRLVGIRAVASPAAPVPETLPDERLALASLFSLAILLHATLLALSHFPEPRVESGDEVRYLAYAETAWESGEAGRHPLWPPLYFQVLTGAFFLGLGRLGVQLAQLGLLWLAAWLLYDLCRHWSGSKLVGTVAGGLVLLYPPLVAFAFYFWPEILHLTLFLGALWILALRSHRFAWLFSAGVLLGLCILTKHVLRPFLPVLLLPLLFEGRRTERLSRLAVVLTGFLVAVAPVLTKLPWPIEDEFTSAPVFNVWTGLNDRSRKNFVAPVVGAEFNAYEQSAPSYAKRNRLLFSKVVGLVEARGLWSVTASQLSRQYFRLFDKDSFLTDQLPGGELASSNAGYRGGPPVLLSALRWGSYILYTLVLIFAVIGIAVCPRRGRRWIWVGFAFLAYNLAIFLVLHVKSRYRIQFMPFLFFFSACGTVWAVEKLRLLRGGVPIWNTDISAKSWCVVAAGQALMLFLAWGGPALD